MKKLFRILLSIMVVIIIFIGIVIYVVATTDYYVKYAHRTYTVPLLPLISQDFDSLELSGKGIKIGVLDAGFGDFKTDRWTQNMMVVDYKNFVEKDTVGFFNDKELHGMKVCRNIGGKIGGGSDTISGLAYDAEYYLAKIDIPDKEPRSDEQRVIAGIKWLLEQHVDIITSSVAFTEFDDFAGYTPAMLDGRSSVLSIFVDSVLASNPNLIFVQSAGNEGDKEWRYISFPGDVREVITVGSSDDKGENRYRSSGVGRDECDYVKPDVVADAHPTGTSFSTPVITGLCAAILEHKRMSRDSLITILHKSATNADAPNREIGYGMPKTEKIVELLSE